MTEAPRRYENFLAEASSGFASSWHYVFAMMIVMAGVAAVIAVFGTFQLSPEKPSEIESAVLVDLPPSEASSQPQTDADTGPQQEAAQASTPQPVLDKIEPTKPVKELEPKPTPAPPEMAPIATPNPPAVLLKKEEKTTPPRPVPAPSTPPQDNRAPPGSENPTGQETDQGDNGIPRPAAHAFTVWQRALMKRLEMAKQYLGRETRVAGLVRVAFVIDGAGTLLDERIASSSGDVALDRAALALVRRAAPFPMAPRGAAARDLSFVVPVRFKR